jgi:hypothetical protein
MADLKKSSFNENLDKYQVLVQDTDVNSKYFKITELSDTFTGGKNAFLIAGSEYLVPDTLVKIEIKDAKGNVIYSEPGEGTFTTNTKDENGNSIITEYYEGTSKIVAVYIYPDTAYGPCTITILGELSSYDSNGTNIPTPFEWQGTYNVKWQKQINVNPALPNTTKIRFYKRPQATITEILSPIYRIESGSKYNSGVYQSFANIKLSQLETFAGDVKRVKVFRTSEGDISDYDLIQDILVESKELLTSYGLSGSVVGQTGILTEETLKNYWNTGSLKAELTSSRVESGVKLSGSGYFTYTSSLDLKSANTYELNLDAFYSSSINSNLVVYLKQLTSSIQEINPITHETGSVPFYISSSIATLEGTQPTKNLLDTTIPFRLDRDYPTASLYFSQSQGEWHLGNISLKLSQDTAFSPDEINFVTTMPTIIGNENYNFKFEFYDVNNNYVPVAVTQSANFTGGNLGKLLRSLTFDSDRTAFRFSTGSYGNPAFQQLGFSVTKTNLTGSVTYGRSVYDTLGNYISPASYAGTYPGQLTNTSDAGATLTIANFSGSVANILVGSIIYTASCEGIEQYETIYRFEDGDNAPGVFVTANTNQFIYKATDLSLNPTGQVITIEAKRKNLASATTPLTVNSGSGKPPLNVGSTNATTGVTTYTLAGSSYPYLTGETIYYISGSDQFGNQFSDSIKISPVKILDGLSATLTNDNASLPSLSNGFVASGSFYFTSGSVNVKVGNETIIFDDDNDGNRANNTFAITNLSGIGCTPNGGNNSNPSQNAYSITNLTADSGSLDITINYKDGAGDTTSLIKTVTYTKNKKAAPVLAISSTPKDQSVTAKSTGAQIDSFANATISVKETYNGSTSTLTITSLTATSADIASISTTPSTGLITLNNKTLADAKNSTTITITAVVTDSEGVSRTLTDTLSLSKVKKAVPNVEVSVSPQAQSVTANTDGSSPSTPTSLTVKALEGGTTRLTSVSAVGTSVTIGTITYDGATAPYNFATIPLSAVAADNASVAITINYTDSEGTTGTKTLTATISKAKKGTNGANGEPGAAGADGRRTATGMIYYQLSAASAPAKPTATSYTFSTNTFAELTSNWSFGAPTFAAGNSNKYWYSTYTAVETTAGGGTATPTFSDVNQAIGFSGLVTFTSANNISDGTNTSNIVEPGSVTNHIGGANVTTINGGRISTGIITSTGYSLPSPDTGGYTLGGTIFNLDNGALRSKNFYISSNGDTSFRGTISAGAGDIGGWTINAGSISKTAFGKTISLDSANSEISLTGLGTTNVRIGTAPIYTLGNSANNTTYIGDGGIMVGGTYSSGELPDNYITLLVDELSPGTNIARQIIYNAVGNPNYEALGITAAPDANNASLRIYQGGARISNSATSNYGYSLYLDGSLYSGGTAQFVGDITANASDKRLKTNIKNIDSPLEKISKINGVYFNWNEKAKELVDKDTEKREVGLIAQDVNEILPEIVSAAPFDIKDTNGESKSGENYLTIQYEKVVPLLVECIKELKTEIEELKRNK